MGRYPKQQWSSGIIASPYGPLGGARLQHIEDWLDTIVNDHDAHVAATGDVHTQYLLEPGSPVANGPVYWTGSLYVSAKLTKDQLDPAAGILKSQLAPLGIVSADVTGPIPYSKLSLAGQITQADLAPSVSLLPSGVILPYGGDTAPSGFVLADGSTYDGTNTTYLGLWNAYGTKFGGTGQSAFQVPDTRGRMLVGKGPHADVATIGLSDAQTAAVRRPKHAHTHTLTMPAHTHTASQPAHNHSIPAFATAVSGPAGGAVSISGSTVTGAAQPPITVDPSGTPAINGGVGISGMTDSPAYLVVNHICKL